MKRIPFILLAAIMILMLSIPGSVLAQSSSPTWNSIIYYYNPGTNAGNLGITFTPPTDPSMDQLNIPVGAHGFGAFQIGSTGEFNGAATVSADVPLVAVYKQYDQGQGAYAPVLYSSFDDTQVSSNGEFYIPSVLHAGYYVSKVGIQNVETEAVSLTLHFIDSTGAEKISYQPPQPLASQGSWIFQLTDDDIPGIGTSFDGSLVIEAVKHNAPGGPARVVAAVEDIQAQGQRSYAYEGSGVTAKAFYLPYANCRYSTNQQSTTFYVQNAGASPATINVYYYTTTGTGITYYTPTAKIPAGARMAVSTCDTKVFAKMNGKNGTARITGDQPLVVIGKATSTDGLSTAFTGQSAGGTRILLPYIPYSKLANGERATLSIMNVGAASAKNVYINYYYQASTTPSYAAQKVVIATTSSPLAKYGKYTAIPKVSGPALSFLVNGNYLGAAEVISDQPVAVVVRVTQAVTGIPGILTLGEDYTGIPCTAGCQ